MKEPVDRQNGTTPLARISPAVLSPADAAAYIGDVHRATLYRLVERGELSPPIRLTLGRVGWTRESLDRFIATRAAASAAAPADPSRYRELGRRSASARAAKREAERAAREQQREGHAPPG